MSEPRIMPQNIEAEQAVLGAILQGGKTPALSSEDFYRPAHGWIFNAILTLEAKGEPIDYLTVKAELVRVERLEEAGGVSYISGLTEQVPATAHIDRYAEEVKAKAILRKIISECRCIEEMAFKEGVRAQEVQDSFQAVALGMDGGSSTGSSLKELGKIQLNQIESAWKNQKPLLGVSTGFKKLDSLTLGWQPPDLIIIAARPGRGKTALGLDIAKAAARGGHKVYFASLEMSAEQLIMRLLSGECGISGRALRCGQFPEGDWSRIVTASGRLAELEIIIDDTSAISELELARRVRRAKPALLVVDYLQLMRSAQKADRKDLEIANITGCLKALAKEVNVPVVLLSQLNREVEKRQGGWLQLSDLRDSGAIEQDADLVLGIRRDPEKTPGSAELICLKHRNGPLGTIELAFREELASFGELARD